MKTPAENPVDKYLRLDRMPHIWCPGCGIGSTVNCFVRAIEDAMIDVKKLAIVSGIGCTGRVAGYMKLDSFHTTHGRAIPMATGVKLANPEMNVVVYSGDGDLFAIGGNHFIHAARRNLDIKVVCVNNFTYGMTGGQVTPTTPQGIIASTMPYGNFEHTFNLPFLAESCGAVYVARWTAAHVKQLTKSMKEMMTKKGFGFIEVLSPCPTLFGRRNKIADGLEHMIQLKERSKIKKGFNAKDASLDNDSEIILGTFVNTERKTFMESMNDRYEKVFGPKYVRYGEEK
ncbi:MAG: 2-oxoacid:ferredoxin oxidoreductase subunit beta [bacterium]|nr:2-oxoacid:ferredoxin oxidoreductase subunit beta [bacterium]